MSARRGTSLLAASVVVAAWLLGSTALAVVGIGLVAAFGAARLWARLVAGELTAERHALDAAPVEGEALRLAVELRGRRWLASQVTWRDRVGALGEHAVPFDRRGRARLVLDRVPRGRYRLGPGQVTASDPLGLTRVEIAVEDEATVLVRPQVPELHTLFTDSGAWGEGGRKAVLRRPSGLEPHGVREYMEGEPLRAVHWPTSARRGELMVRELEDAPRDSVAILLDVEASAVAGPPGDSSLDESVRIAAGLLRAHAVRSRRAMLVIGGAEPQVHRIRALGHDWEAVLDALAAAEPSRSTPLQQLMASRGVLAHVPELVVVTCRPETVADALVARTAVGRWSALVAIDAPTYAGRGPSAPSPTLLRLAGAGVPLAVVRHGLPLAEALGSIRVQAVG
ncbi:MAG TPA: DUF58 domain-containing protein [Gaiella sp.]|nr:DUF58 domain-containing protein [Gaiella sp.]